MTLAIQLSLISMKSLRNRWQTPFFSEPIDFHKSSIANIHTVLTDVWCKRVLIWNVTKRYGRKREETCQRSDSIKEPFMINRSPDTLNLFIYIRMFHTVPFFDSKFWGCERTNKGFLPVFAWNVTVQLLTDTRFWHSNEKTRVKLLT